ncbi:MAG: TlpA disulfide reductase family protein [Pyrinomonadaceae bacterium]
MRIVFFCLVSILGLLGCRPSGAPLAVSNQPISINDRPTTNLPMPPSKALVQMSWTNANDRVEKLGDFVGKAVILDFWATYCEPCKREIPHLNALAAKYGDSLHIVGLNVGGEEDRVKIPAFVAATTIDYAIAYPDDDLTKFIFAERSDIPQTAIFNRQGVMVKKIVGFSPAIQQELDAAVAQAVDPSL